MTVDSNKVDEEGSAADDNATEEETLKTPTISRGIHSNRIFKKTRIVTIFSKYSGCALTGTISFISFFTPILMVLIPKFGGKSWPTEECETECQSLLISFTMRLLILLVGTWALFWRKPQSNMPRVFKGRATVILILFILISVYWLFYVVRVIAIKESNYHVVVGFASNIIDCLIFIHYLAVVLVELRHLRSRYVVKIVRSPDGASSQFSVGPVSVQRLAIMCLNHYQTHFESYNIYLDRMMAARQAKMSRTSEFKIYNMQPSEEASTSHQVDGGRNGVGTSSGTRNLPFELMHLEEGHKRKVQKRKWKLLVAAEQSFENIRNLQIQKIGGLQLSNSYEAAQAVFAGLASPLQKYLRTTRQQPRHSVEGIISHIEQCLLYSLSAKAFLQEYLSQGLGSEEDKQDWILLSKINVNAGIYNGSEFCLRKGGVSLMIRVASLPFFNISEGDVVVHHPSSQPSNHPSNQTSNQASTQQSNHFSTTEPPSLPPRHVHETHL